MPSETTPRSLACLSLVPSGILAPGRATATVCPAATFGAPQTIVAGGVLAEVDGADLQPIGVGVPLGAQHPPDDEVLGEGTPWWWIASTFVPVIVRRSSTPAMSRSGSQYSRSHSRERASELLQEAQIVLVVAAAGRGCRA